MSETTPTNARALREAAARLRRILIVAAVVRPLGTLMCAAGSTMVLLAATWWFLDRMVRSGMRGLAAWIAGGYLATVAVLATALVGGRSLGLDIRVIGVSVIAVILVGMFAEATVLSQARILVVEPNKDDSADRP